MPEELTISRIFEASVEEVWDLWVNPELVKKWWGPGKFTCPVAEIDFRPGGISKVSMISTELGFPESFSIWQYVSIEPFSKIELIQNLADKNGIKQRPVDLGMPADFPENIRTVVSFKSIGPSKTEMTVTEFANFGQMSHFAKLGLEQSLDKAVLVFENR